MNRFTGSNVGNDLASHFFGRQRGRVRAFAAVTNQALVSGHLWHGTAGRIGALPSKTTDVVVPMLPGTGSSHWPEPSPFWLWFIQRS